MRDLNSLPKKHLLKVMEKMAKDLAELKVEKTKAENQLKYRIRYGVVGRLVIWVKELLRLPL